MKSDAKLEQAKHEIEILSVHQALGEALAHLDILASEHAKAVERVSDLEGRLRGLARKGHHT